MKNFNEAFKLIRKVMSTTSEKDKEILWEYAQKVPDNGIIVDVGTASGGSAFTLTFASKPSVKVFTIDPASNEQFHYWQKEWKLEERLFFLNQTSGEVAQGWDKPINLLFIDGVHSDLGVKNDIQGLGKFVKEGSFILFHDYYLYDGIAKTINEAVGEKLIEKIRLVESKKPDGTPIGLFIARKLPWQ